MRNYSLYFCLCLFFSCNESKDAGSPEEGNILENLTFSVDTVVIDPGEDFINLGFGLGAFDLTKDKKQLLFFENKPLNLITVDLDGLKVLEKNEFDSEGPNSVGSFIGELETGPSQQIFLKGFNAQGIFNTNGELNQDLKIFPDGLDPEYTNDFLKLYGSAIYDFQSKKLYSQPYSEIAKINELWIIDPSSKSMKTYSIPKMKSVSDYYITLTQKTAEGTNMMYYGPSDYMDMQNGQLLISGGSMSGFYKLKLGADSIEFVDIKHKTVPNEWNITVINDSPDEAIFRDEQRKIAEQINFMDLKWDETRQLYLRLGKRTFLGENRGDPNTYEIYLFAYDKDFHVLGETKVENLEKVPSSYFWKEGQLWSYVNVEDELGFAVFTFDI